MNVTSLTTAERIACAICWLYRWRGQRTATPVAVQYEVTERHGPVCDWCDYPMDELIRLCELKDQPKDDPAERPFDYEMFKRYPAHVQRDLVIKALHEERA